MGEFKIKFVHTGPPKEWKGPHGSVWYHTVDVEGHDKPISVGKKEPNTLKAGDTIYGDITETDFIEDKFKASPPPQTGGSQSFDDRGDAITASMVVKLAFQAFIQSEGMLPQEAAHWRQIDYMSDMLKQSIDKVKNGTEVKSMLDKAEPLPLPPEDLNDIE